MAVADFHELTTEDVERLSRQRELIRATLDTVGETGGPSLSSLQRLIERGVFEPRQTYELQCLGVCFGDLLSADTPLQRAIIEDEFGRDPTLRWGDTSLHLNALTLISKRIERGETVDLSDMRAGLLEWLQAKADELRG